MAGSRTYRTKVLVLDKTKLKETDLILTMLDERGRQVRAVAKGARKPGGRLAARCELFCTVDMLLAHGRSLDVDAMRIVADGVNKMHTPETSAIVITHYERLLDMIKPDVVHVLYKGRIVKTAGPELAKEIEQRGYDWIKAELEEE